MSSDRIVYGAYAIGALCAAGGVYLGWRGHLNDREHKAARRARKASTSSTSSSSSSTSSTPKSKINKRRRRAFMKKMPTEAAFLAELKGTEKKYQRGGFYEPDVLMIRELIAEVAANEELKPYSLNATLECLEWLNAYHSTLTAMTLQMAQGVPASEMKEQVMMQRDECRAELEPFWDIVVERSQEAATSVKDKLRVGNILVAMASAQKWFVRLSESYRMLRDINPEDHELEKQQGGYHIQQVINLFLTAPCLGEWADLAKFSDLMDKMRKGGGFKGEIINSVFQAQQHLQLMMYVARHLADLPQTPPDPSTLKDAFIPIVKLRKKLTKGESTDKELQEAMSTKVGEWKEIEDTKQHQVLLEGASAHILGLTERSLLSGSYTPDKIFAILEHPNGLRKDRFEATRVTDEPDKGDNFWRGKLSVQTTGLTHRSSFEHEVEFELGEPKADF